jgi:hypothetical protein
MIGPEPDEPLGKADARLQRGVDARARLVEINALRHGRSGVGRCGRPFSSLLGRLLGSLFGSFGGGWRAGGVVGLAHSALGLARGALLPLEGEHSARIRRAGSQGRLGEASAIGALELRPDSAARIAGNCGDGAVTRPKAEPVQRQSSFESWITRHGRVLEIRAAQKRSDICAEQ